MGIVRIGEEGEGCRVEEEGCGWCGRREEEEEVAAEGEAEGGCDDEIVEGLQERTLCGVVGVVAVGGGGDGGGGGSVDP